MMTPAITPARPPALALLASLLVAVLAIAPCRAAAPVIGVGGVRQGSGALPEAHGWFIAPSNEKRDPGAMGPDAVPPEGVQSEGSGEPDPGARDQTGDQTNNQTGVLLVHLPPRQAAIHKGVPGVGRRSRSLDEPPLAIAARGGRVYLLAPNPRSADGTRYVVRTIEAVRTPVPGIWADAPAGRMESLPPLDAGGEAIGLAATTERLAALVRTEEGFSFATFDGDRWDSAPIPAELARPLGQHPALHASAAAFAVVGESHALISGPDGAWRSLPLSLPAGAVPVGVLGESIVAWSASPRRGGSPEQSSDSTPAKGLGSAAVLLANDSGVERIASVTVPVNPDFLALTVVPDASGRLVIARGERAPDSDAMSYALTEISLSTGAVLYEGKLESVTPVTREEFNVLAGTLVVMMVISLMIVLRPVPSETELTLPDRCVLATPGRRLLASGLDLGICAMIVSRFSGVPFGEIIGLTVLVRPDGAWLTLPAVLAVGLVYSTLSETIFSATLGKLALGCRVVGAPSSGGPPRRIGFVRTLVRNSVKWGLPPAASLALIEPTGRHRGDLLAGAIVAIALEDDDEPGHRPSERGSADSDTTPGSRDDEGE